MSDIYDILFSDWDFRWNDKEIRYNDSFKGIIFTKRKIRKLHRQYPCEIELTDNGFKLNSDYVNNSM